MKQPDLLTLLGLDLDPSLQPNQRFFGQLREKERLKQISQLKIRVLGRFSIVIANPYINIPSNDAKSLNSILQDKKP